MFARYNYGCELGLGRISYESLKDLLVTNTINENTQLMKKNINENTHGESKLVETVLLNAWLANPTQNEKLWAKHTGR